MAYCRWAGVELPSEAQWEAAARGTDAREYPWGNEKPTAQHAKFGNNPSGWPDPVGRYPAGAGPYGTMDQAGNVWEWCLDRYEGTAYRGRDGQVDPVVSGDENAEKVLRVMRGGSWDGPSEYLRAAVRGGSPVRGRSRHLGFRVLFRSSPEP